MEQSGPLPETIPLKPANVYGQGKLEMEQRVQALCPGAVLLRATWMYDLPGYRLPIRGNLPLNLLRAAQRGESVRFSVRDFRGITYVRQAVALLEAALTLPGGVYNFGSENAEDMVLTARQFAETLGIMVDIQEADWARNLAMDCSKLRAHGIVFDTTQAGLTRCLSGLWYCSDRRTKIFYRIAQKTEKSTKKAGVFCMMPAESGWTNHDGSPSFFCLVCRRKVHLWDTAIFHTKVILILHLICILL